MFPYAVISDHSLEHGGNNSEDYVKAAISQKTGRLCLLDYDVMSSVMSFIKATRNSNVRPIIGVYLPVFIPDFTSYTATLIANKIQLTENFEWLDNLTLPQSKELVLASVSYLKSKSKKKSEIFIERMLLVDIHLETIDIERLAQSAANQKFLFDEPMSVFRMAFIAKTSNGYKSLLKLSSEMAVNEQAIKHLKKDDCIENRAVSLEQILKYTNDVIVIDPLLDDSLLGRFISNDLLIDKNIINTINILNVVIGVTQIVKPSWLSYASKLDVKKIPFPVAMFAESYQFEEFCVKHAALSKSPMLRLQYQAPVEKKAYIWDPVSLNRYYSNLFKETAIDMDFWNDIDDTHVVIDKIILPHYKLPQREVAAYACERQGLQCINPIMTFDSIIKSICPVHKEFMLFRREQYEALYMHKLGWEGVQRKCAKKIVNPDTFKALQKRYQMEYEAIDVAGFAGYFLIIQDIIGHARRIGVPVGAGRGAHNGSLILYGLDITDIDPLDFGLQFEPLLKSCSLSMPHIGIDLGNNGVVGRKDIIKYINDKYGNDNLPFESISEVAKMSRFGISNSFDFACEAYGLPAYYKQYIKNLIDKVEIDLSINLPAIIDFDDLTKHDAFASKLLSEPVLYKITQRAKGLFGKSHTTDVIAGGVAISPTMIPDHSALVCSVKGNLVSQFDEDDMQTAGLIKFDILELINLTVLSETNKNIIKRNGIPINFRAIDMFIPEVFSMINQGLTKGIFQIESQDLQSLIKALQPSNIEGFGDLFALLLPGALQSGITDDYIQTKHGIKPVTHYHHAVQEVTVATYGFILYEWQVKLTLRLVAGYTLEDADLFCRTMVKKKKSEILRNKNIFITRSLKFWREVNINKGKSLASDFDLDVVLNDISARAPSMLLDGVLEDGVFASTLNTMLYMKCLMGLSNIDFKRLELRLNDTRYTVILFKQHYQAEIYLSVQHRLIDKDPVFINEVKIRIYYAMAQWVRFQSIFNKIENFSGFGFNKSNAIGSSIAIYKSAYTKYHHAPEFYAACLTYTDIDGLDELAKEAYQYKKIQILKPDINRSAANFEVESDHSIRYGLAKLIAVKDIATSIIETRKIEEGFRTVWHFVHGFLNHTGYYISVDVVVALAMTGGFDEFVPNAIRKNKEINSRQFMQEIARHSISHPLADFSRMHNIMNMMDYDIKKSCVVWCFIYQKKGVDAYCKKQMQPIDFILSSHLLVLSKMLDMGKKSIIKIDVDSLFLSMLEFLTCNSDVLIFVIKWIKDVAGMTTVDSVNEEKRLSGLYQHQNR